MFFGGYWFWSLEGLRILGPQLVRALLGSILDKNIGNEFWNTRFFYPNLMIKQTFIFLIIYFSRGLVLIERGKEVGEINQIYSWWLGSN